MNGPDMERPYRQAAALEALVERWEESDDYTAALIDWCLSSPDVATRFASTPQWESAFEAWCNP